MRQVGAARRECERDGDRDIVADLLLGGPGRDRKHTGGAGAEPDETNEPYDRCGLNAATQRREQRGPRSDVSWSRTGELLDQPQDARLGGRARRNPVLLVQPAITADARGSTAQQASRYPVPGDATRNRRRGPRRPLGRAPGRGRKGPSPQRAERERNDGHDRRQGLRRPGRGRTGARRRPRPARRRPVAADAINRSADRWRSGGWPGCRPLPWSRCAGRTVRRSRRRRQAGHGRGGQPADDQNSTAAVSDPRRR